MTDKNCFGFCQHCHSEHDLPQGEALEAASSLLSQLGTYNCLDFAQVNHDPRFHTDYLFGPALGQMFGVLTGIDRQGNTITLKAFSCQYNGCWQIPGWEDPLFDVPSYLQTIAPIDKQIKQMGAELSMLSSNMPAYRDLFVQRRQLSQELMKSLHRLYVLHNFAGRTTSLAEAFLGKGGIPTGCGDCCAPKLLNAAAQKGIHPTGIAEFYFGKPNRSGSKQSHHFYSCCAEKCQPILGFLLCGLDKGE